MRTQRGSHPLRLSAGARGGAPPSLLRARAARAAMFSEGTAPGTGALAPLPHVRQRAPGRGGLARRGQSASPTTLPGGAGATAGLGPARSRRCRDERRRRRRRRWCPLLPPPGAWAPRCPSCLCSSTCSTRVSRGSLRGCVARGAVPRSGPRPWWLLPLPLSLLSGLHGVRHGGREHTPHPLASPVHVVLRGGNISGKGERREVQRCHLITRGCGEGCVTRARPLPVTYWG